MERLSGVHFLAGSGSHAGLLPGLGAEIHLRNVLFTKGPAHVSKCLAWSAVKCLQRFVRAE